MEYSAHGLVRCWVFVIALRLQESLTCRFIHFEVVSGTPGSLSVIAGSIKIHILYAEIMG
ncbi:MAG: hypothetical protein CVV51_00135 [Spirochaetae bacterium HGW-Spirochaetae-7]|nr:MAG: hypothetical protein CVV51_00135 [Spirochaetae bacterium HGW-Spirochaetae-7]